MRINIIGDIHGRTCWKDLVKDDCVNVFVGDYFDPYDRIDSIDLVNNFTDIVRFKAEHPETVLLYGNHDMHYIWDCEGLTSRFDSKNSELYKELFKEFQDMFYGVAYAPGDKHLITHAGVTSEWFDKYADTESLSCIDMNTGKVTEDCISTKNMELFVNNLWKTDKQAFDFISNCDIFDTYGTTPEQSPVWVRPDTLIEHNYYTGTDIVQIVGHTQMKRIVDLSDRYGVVIVDCLGTVPDSYTLDI